MLLLCHFFVVGFDNLIFPCGTDAVLWKIKEEHIVIQIAACWKKVYIAVRHFHEKSGEYKLTFLQLLMIDNSLDLIKGVPGLLCLLVINGV